MNEYICTILKKIVDEKFFFYEILRKIKSHAISFVRFYLKIKVLIFKKVNHEIAEKRLRKTGHKRRKIH